MHSYIRLAEKGLIVECRESEQVLRDPGYIRVPSHVLALVQDSMESSLVFYINGDILTRPRADVSSLTERALALIEYKGHKLSIQLIAYVKDSPYPLLTHIRLTSTEAQHVCSKFYEYHSEVVDVIVARVETGQDEETILKTVTEIATRYNKELTEYASDPDRN